ncbi:MAG: alpha/beta hydrolase fold domain-containing protein [Gammaproteobacteria bacterium]|nr:alpha/beta hydrolase fold domain-containing protein [Gammaproteobacteria bacterium]
MPRHIENLSFNSSQQLDLYLADKPGQPMVVCLHGGGFHSGSRSDERCRQSAALLLRAGFNCASISYSLAPLEDRFSMWPRNLFDVADALTYLHGHADIHGYDFNRPGMLGFSAGCCLSNLYIQGGANIFRHFGYETPVFKPAALVGFYGPYHFPSRQRERRSDDDEINRYHSPSWWLRQDTGYRPPPVLHIQGNKDTIVLPEQHFAFQNDYEVRGSHFKAMLLEGFGHSFAPMDTNQSGKSIDLGSDITRFFVRYLLS